MVGGHLDSWQGGTGATDNGVGSAVMLEVIRVLKALNLKLDRTVRIGLWGGEEEGLFGSREYVKKTFADPTKMETTPEWDKFSAYYNVDNGSGKIRGVYLQGNEMVRPFFEAMLAPFKDMGVSAITIRNTGGTDHQSFDAVGLPGFQFIQDPLEYGTRTHHSNMDVYDRVVRGDLMQMSWSSARWSTTPPIASRNCRASPSRPRAPPLRPVLIGLPAKKETGHPAGRPVLAYAIRIEASDLRLFVLHVLAGFRVVLLQFELFGLRFRVLARGVKMAGAGRGNHANENTGHRLTPLKLNALRLHLGEHGVHSQFVDNLQALGADAQLHEASQRGDHSRFDCMFGSKMRRVFCSRATPCSRSGTLSSHRQTFDINNLQRDIAGAREVPSQIIHDAARSPNRPPAGVGPRFRRARSAATTRSEAFNWHRIGPGEA